MSKSIRCPAGQWTRLIDNWASGMPASWSIEFQSEIGESKGLVKESRGMLPFGIGMTTSQHDLRRRMTFERYWINASYRLEVCPEIEVQASFL